jgi:cell wall-associated NlpC family hydrolase
VKARAALQAVLQGPARAVLLFVVIAGAGVAFAAFVGPGSDMTPAERAATTAMDEGEAISLEALDRRAPPRSADPPPDGPAPRPSAVIGVGTGEFSSGSVAGVEDVDGPAVATDTRIPSDAEIKRELTAFRDHIEGMDPRKGARAYIDGNGRAVLPEGAPRAVALVVAAANEIATKPYKWGGGHGAWKDSGYDCSGSVSFALAGARLLDSPLDSSGLMRFGAAGPGRWITIYSNPGHVFTTVAGLRFDTSGQGSAGTRWQRGAKSNAGYTVRHPPGL